MIKLKSFLNRKIFHYLLTFIIMILIFIIALVMEKALPNYRQKDHIIKSHDYYVEYLKNNYQTLSNVLEKHTTIDTYSDTTSLSIIYLENNKKPFSEFIEMNYDQNAVNRIVEENGFQNFEKNGDYARYWHGNLIILKVLLSFFTMKSIYDIYYCYLLIVFFILIMELFKKSKKLAIAYILSSIMINTFFVSKCDALIHVFSLSMLISIIMIKMIESNSKHIDILFLISGMITCFFDLLSCETVTLTVPLFIYIYLKGNDNKKIIWKNVLLYILLWVIGYAATFLTKWLITVLYYNGHFMDKIFIPMTKRVAYEDKGIIATFFNSIKDVLKYLYPFQKNRIKLSIIVIGIVSFIYGILEIKNRNKYLMLFMIGIIPFIRYLVLSSHSDYHNYFTYRAFIPTIMLLFICIMNLFQAIIIHERKYNNRNKRRLKSTKT